MLMLAAKEFADLFFGGWGWVGWGVGRERGDCDSVDQRYFEVTMLRKPYEL